jgi:hypothetical protein
MSGAHDDAPPSYAESSAIGVASSSFAANASEAASALARGRDCMARSEYEKAERLIAISVRMHPTTEATQELARVRRRRRGAVPGGDAMEGQQQSAASPSSNGADASASVRPFAGVAASPAAAPVRVDAPAAAPIPPPPVPAAADAPVAGGVASSIAWRQHTLHPPALIATYVPSLGGRSLTYAYPAFLYVPPLQRRPLLIVWALASVLLLIRMLGWMPRAYGTRRYDDDDEYGGDYRHRSREHYRGGGDYGLDGESPRGRTWTSESSTERVVYSRWNLNNFISLLPFLFFFVGPIAQRYMQQNR